MARKPNYDFEKRRKEQERKAKKEAKAQRKRDAIANGENPDADEFGDVTAVPDADLDTESTPEQQPE